MSIVIEPELHHAFKAATAERGEKMSKVLIAFIRSYVEKYAPAAAPQPKKGGR